MSLLSDLGWRLWSPEYVVHHALSNDTYRLTELAGRLLLALRRGDALDEDTLARECGVTVDEVGRTLAALAELELVGRC